MQLKRINCCPTILIRHTSPTGVFHSLDRRIEETVRSTITTMCGIFAYMGYEPLAVIDVLKVLKILEKEQEPGEKSPVGGHGAGIVFLNKREQLTLVKVGKTNGSPVENLKLQLKETAVRSRLVLGHVRRASPEFEKTIRHKECTQPYKPKCRHNFSFVSAHNGKVQNYLQLKKKLGSPHKFESQKIDLIDSEVIPHLFEELLSNSKHPTKATHSLFDQIESTDKQGNTVAILGTNKKQEAHLNIIQKGPTRGLTLWTNPQHEVLLCSREPPIEQTMKTFITKNKFQKTITIKRAQPINLEAHFKLKLHK